MTRPDHETSPATELVKGWTVRRTVGTAASFHAEVPPDDPPPSVWIHRPNTRALVLGSTQPGDLVGRDVAEHDGLEVCRRRSGGGLVYLDPQTDCWIDVIIPRTSPLWDDDVGRAFHWVGERWAQVLSAPPAPVAPVVSTSQTRSPAGQVWCFADLGHGEVSVGGSKVVGLSQRRTRTWCRIQCLVLAAWPGAELRRYVDLQAAVRQRPELAGHVDQLDPVLVEAGFPAGHPVPAPSALTDGFFAALPSAGR